MAIMVVAVSVVTVILLLVMVMAILVPRLIVVMAIVVPGPEEALLSELLDPGIHTSVGLVCLVSLIKHQTNEPAFISVGSGCSVIVAILGGISEHFAASVLDHLVELT